jgi:hypothetical protein
MPTSEPARQRPQRWNAVKQPQSSLRWHPRHTNALEPPPFKMRERRVMRKRVPSWMAKKYGHFSALNIEVACTDDKHGWAADGVFTLLSSTTVCTVRLNE